MVDRDREIYLDDQPAAPFKPWSKIRRAFVFSGSSQPLTASRKITPSSRRISIALMSNIFILRALSRLASIAALIK